MAKKFFFMSALLLSLSVFRPAFAQVVDMRAYSRQHGFKAYQNNRSVSVRQPVVAQKRHAKLKKEESEKGTDASSADRAVQTSEEEKKAIHQQGIKIFQEKDEDKVMNFDVENSEFKKLNKQQQQDLISRITIE